MMSIAVVIPCYNLGRTVDEALNSVREQTYPAAEVVIIDDGSTDIYTRQILARIEGSGTTVIRTVNRGVAAARNLGIQRTSALCIVLLDADDLLEPTYLEKTGRILEVRNDLDFVSCAIQAFEGASYTWCPPPCTLTEILTRGGPHISTAFRRTLWEKVGGFDESLSGYEDTDFWILALEAGCSGEVLEEPLLRYRVRSGSRYHRAITPSAYVSTMGAIYRKHLQLVMSNGLEILLAKESFLREQFAHRRYVEEKQMSLERERADLQAQIASSIRILQDRGIEPLDWGSLRRTTRIQANWHSTNIMPIHDYYVGHFLEQCKSDIHGQVLEYKAPRYTQLYASSRVIQSHVLDVDSRNDQATVIADLTVPGSIPADTFDCIVLPQMLQGIYDFRAALAHVYRSLKSGGVLLCTVPSVSRCIESRDENDRYGDFWRFTEASVRNVFAELFPPESFEVSSYGNVMIYAAILHGLTAEELTERDLNDIDPLFPVICCVRAVKPVVSHVGGAEGGKRKVPTVSSYSHPQEGNGAIIFYHRIAALAPDTYGLCVRPEDFQAHMKYLHDHYYPMALDELAAASITGDVPRGAVAVTLDDGYLDSLATASNILLDFNVPATFFITTDRIKEQHEFWWDVLERIFLLENALPGKLDLYQDGRCVYRTGTIEERITAHKAMVEVIYPLSSEDQESIVSDIVKWSGLDLTPRPTHRPMTSKEIIALSERRGHTIGAHTTHHLSLPLQPTAVRRREIFENKQYLENLLGRAVTAFSYPYGEVDGTTMEIVRSASFKLAVTVEGRQIRSGANPFLLPRFEIKSCNAHNFSQQLIKIFAEQPTESLS